MAGNLKTIKANDQAVADFKAQKVQDEKNQSKPGVFGMFAQNARLIVGPLKLCLPRLKTTAYDGFERGVTAAANAYQKNHENPTFLDKLWDKVFGNKPAVAQTVAHGHLVLHDKTPRKPTLTP